MFIFNSTTYRCRQRSMLQYWAIVAVFWTLLRDADSIPTTVKRRYTLLTRDKTTWNDINKYCNDNFNGYILTIHDETIARVIKKYKGMSPWSSKWSEDIWLGLYMNNHNSKDYTWLGTCSASSPTYFDWECGNSCDPTLDSTKLCGKAKKDELVWDFEVCGIHYNGVCEETTGACSFEDYSGSRSCIQGSHTKDVIASVTKEQCKEQCKTKIKSNKECWAVSYVGAVASPCTLYYSSNPFEFDTDGSSFDTTSCASGSLVIWKRCFESPATDNGALTTNYESTSQPLLKCTAPVATTTTTTTTTTPSTTSETTTTTTTTTTTLPTTSTTSATTTTTTTPATTTTTDSTTTSTTTATTAATTSTTTDATTTTTTTDATTTTTTTAQTAATTSTATDATTTTSTTSGQSVTTTSTASDATTTTTTPAQTAVTTSTASDATTTTSATSEQLLTTTSTTTDATTTTTSTSGQTVATESTSANNATNSSSASSAQDSSTSSSTAVALASQGQQTENTSLCVCPCIEYTNTSLEEIIQALKRELTVNKKTTSSYLRKLTSASDDRPSAQGIGLTLGVGVITFVIIGLTIGDVLNALRWVVDTLQTLKPQAKINSNNGV